MSHDDDYKAYLHNKCTEAVMPIGGRTSYMADLMERLSSLNGQQRDELFIEFGYKASK